MNSMVESSLHRILVVDDNPSIHQDFRKILCPEQSPSTAVLAGLAQELFGDAPTPKSSARFEMDSAFQGQEALVKVQAAELEGRPYSLAFVDVRMPPGWDGIETITQIWKQYPHIQVVICTAYSDYSWDQIIQNLGESDSLVILKKPFDNVEVLQLAHALTKKWIVTRQANARLADLDESVRLRTAELLTANRELQSEIQRRTEMEIALRESEERFRQAFETISVALAILPLDSGKLIDANPSFVQLTGYSKEELVGQTLEALQLPEISERCRQLGTSAAQGQSFRNLKLRLQRKDGEPRQTLLSLEKLRLGAQDCALLALADETDRQQLEAQLRQAQKMEAVGQLAAGIAHDFNNLLTVIHGHSSLQLAKSVLDADIVKAFSQVRMASERASALTRQLLAFSRRQVVQRRPIQLAAMLDRSQSLLVHAVGGFIQFECHCEDNLPSVDGDETSLEHVLMNLAVNARDAMPRGGRLVLTLTAARFDAAEAARHAERRAGSFVRLTVADTGCGMDKATLAHIFEPFFTTKPIGRGTGLGLSTVYGIVKQHEGWVEVDSQPGQGTAFHLLLPAIDRSLAATDAPTPPPCARAKVTSPNATILVVEDEPAVRDFVSNVLAQQGYQVEQASSGVEALAKWKDRIRQVGLLLTDIVMPGGVNGRALAQEFQQCHPALKVMYTSGYQTEVLRKDEVSGELKHFLAKPFTPDHLLNSVQTILGCAAAAPRAAAGNAAGTNFCQI